MLQTFFYVITPRQKVSNDWRSLLVWCCCIHFNSDTRLRPETRVSMPVSCCAIGYYASITYGQWRSYRNIPWVPWGIHNNNHLSHSEYTEDAQAAERRFKRVETADYEPSHLLIFLSGTTKGGHPRSLGRHGQLKGWLSYHLQKGY